MEDAKSTKAFKGKRFVGDVTNNLTPEFKAFLVSRRAGRKKAVSALKEVVKHTAEKAVLGSNEVSLRELNHSIPGPRGSKYRKPAEEFVSREKRDYVARETRRERKQKLEQMRPHTTEFTHRQRFEHENARIREKKKNAVPGKERTQYREFRVKKNTSSARACEGPRVVDAPKVPELTKEELLTLAEKDADLLGLVGVGGAEKRTSGPVGSAGHVNDLEQELFGF